MLPPLIPSVSPPLWESLTLIRANGPYNWAHWSGNMDECMGILRQSIPDWKDLREKTTLQAHAMHLRQLKSLCTHLRQDMLSPEQERQYLEVCLSEKMHPRDIYGGLRHVDNVGYLMDFYTQPSLQTRQHQSFVEDLMLWTLWYYPVTQRRPYANWGLASQLSPLATFHHDDKQLAGSTPNDIKHFTYAYDVFLRETPEYWRNILSYFTALFEEETHTRQERKSPLISKVLERAVWSMEGLFYCASRASPEHTWLTPITMQNPTLALTISWLFHMYENMVSTDWLMNRFQREGIELEKSIPALVGPMTLHVPSLVYDVVAACQDRLHHPLPSWAEVQALATTVDMPPPKILDAYVHGQKPSVTITGDENSLFV